LGDILSRVAKTKQTVLAKIKPENRAKYQSILDKKTLKQQKSDEIQADIDRLEDAVSKSDVRLRNQLTMQRQQIDDEVMDLGKELAELTKQ
jgi:hypothetical protein